MASGLYLPQQLVEPGQVGGEWRCLQVQLNGDVCVSVGG